MAWRRPGAKPLSEPRMVSLPTHICVTLPQWDNSTKKRKSRYVEDFFFHYWQHQQGVSSSANSSTRTHFRVSIYSINCAHSFVLFSIVYEVCLSTLHFTGTGAIIWLAHYRRRNHEGWGCGLLAQQNTTKREPCAQLLGYCVQHTWYTFCLNLLGSIKTIPHLCARWHWRRSWNIIRCGEVRFIAVF